MRDPVFTVAVAVAGRFSFESVLWESEEGR